MKRSVVLTVRKLTDETKTFMAAAGVKAET